MLEKTLESPLDCKEIQPVHPKEISPEYSLEVLMLKLKLQYFDHLMWRTDSFEKTLMLEKIEGGRRRGRQRMRQVGDLCLWLLRRKRIRLYFTVSSSSVQLLSQVRLFATPWTTAHQASLSITNFRSLLKFMSVESVMPSNHLILCHPLLLLPSISPRIRVFSNESVLHIR